MFLWKHSRPSVAAGAVAALAVFALAGACAASPISMLDSASNAPAKLKPETLPTINNATVRPISSLDEAQPGNSFGSDRTAAPTSSGLSIGATNGSAQSNAGDSLRDVLHSIMSLHQAAPPAPQGPPSKGPSAFANAADGYEDDASSIDLRRLILNSEVAGKMLRSIVDVQSADGQGATFSIFGLGNFALDVAPDLHAVIVSELSSGMAFHMSLTGDGRGYDSYPSTTLNGNALSDVPHEHINLVRVAWTWLLDFLSSPVGALLAMSAGITLVMWVCVKSVVFLQRRASRYE